jgi:DNA-binding transcriptional MerR regulator
MRVGDFARMGNVSSRTLRFYCQVGLLMPVGVDPGNGYRHYEPRQLAQLHRIQEFKEMGFSLSEIREFSRRRLSTAEWRELFYERRAALVDKIKQNCRSLAQLDAHLDMLETNRGTALESVCLRQIQPTWVVSLRDKIHRYEEAEELFEEVERHIDLANLSEPRAALWHACANTGSTIDCEVLRFLKRPIPGRRPLRTFQLPATTVASVFHLGGDRTLEHAYRVLSAWLATSSYRLAGPKCEIYWQEARGSKLESLTEIQFPVVQARRRKRPMQIGAA